jgi:predicted AAA+ superfamily ATPase
MLKPFNRGLEFWIFLLKPHYRNYNKTLIKRPKIYFYDTGIVCSLLGMAEKNQLINHPLRGALFECFVISEFIKKRYNTGKEINLYYWRDKTGHEIDLIIDEPDQPFPIEIKSGKTVHSEFFKNLKYWQKISGINRGRIIYAGDSDQKRSDGFDVISWRDLAVQGFIY